MSDGRCVFLRPMDRVYFGSPRAQTAGEVGAGQSEFPPSPYTVAGMLRTHLLEGAEPALELDAWSSAHREQRAALVGTAERLPAGWQLVGPFPATETGKDRHLEPWLPRPAWVAWGRDRRLHPATVLTRGALRQGAGGELGDATPLADDDPAFAPRLWVGSPRVKEPEVCPAWIPAELLAKLLATTEPVDLSSSPWAAVARSSHEPPFVRRELAPGVAIDPDSKTAKDGMLYSLEMLRFAPGSGLLAWLDAPLEPPLRASSLEQGFGRAGRKGQSAAFESASGRVAASWRKLLAGEHLEWDAAGATFWLYLATPARMDDPLTEVVAELRALAPSGASVSLLSVATGEAQIIGGLSIDGGRPRKNARYARAGSGWLLQVSAPSLEERTRFLRRLHGCASLGPKEERAFGFGLTFVGRGPCVPTTGDDAGATADREERSESI